MTGNKLLEFLQRTRMENPEAMSNNVYGVMAAMGCEHEIHFAEVRMNKYPDVIELVMEEVDEMENGE